MLQPRSSRSGLFLPQVPLAILASSLAPKFVKRWSLKRVLVAGVVADLVSMSLLASSRLLLTAHDAAFGLLLIAIGALGFSFGATVMALNTYAGSFFPGRSDRAVLWLNALLGTGTALAPLLIAAFLGLGAWWALPILVACVLTPILGGILRQPLQFSSPGNVGNSAVASRPVRQLSSRFWLYAAAAFLYGIVETLNGNWATLYLTLQRGVPAQGAGGFRIQDTNAIFFLTGDSCI